MTPRSGTKRRNQRAVRTHRFIPSEAVDYAGVPICAKCGALETYRTHDGADTPGEQQDDLSNRIIGEADA